MNKAPKLLPMSNAITPGTSSFDIRFSICSYTTAGSTPLLQLVADRKCVRVRTGRVYSVLTVEQDPAIRCGSDSSRHQSVPRTERTVKFNEPHADGRHHDHGGEGTLKLDIRALHRHQ